MGRILITGSNGQLGSEIRKLSSSFPQLVLSYTDVDELDISNYQSLETFIKANSIEMLINCGAYTNVDKAESDVVTAYKVNAEAPKFMAELSKKYQFPIIHVSTDYVFDGKSESPYRETDPVGPVTQYGKSKLAGEQYLIDSYKTVIIRTSWLYSTFGHNFVKTIIRLSNEKSELKVVNDQFGSPTYAEDLAKTILALAHLYYTSESSFIAGIYHYSNEGECSWYEFAKEILSMNRSDCKIIPVTSAEFPSAAKRPSYSLMDKTKIKTTFGIEIPHWKESLRRMLNLLRDSK
jgi:dTDP-4-dehydrorhamnose reductase